MQWQFAPTSMPIRRRNLNRHRDLLVCLSLSLLLPFCAVAQTSKMVTLKPVGQPTKFKLKPVRKVTSDKIRIGDYVEFKLIEDVKLRPDGGGDRETVIAKDTPVFGQVVDRHHRFTIFKSGKFSVAKLQTTTVDGQPIALDIKRPEGDALREAKKRKRFGSTVYQCADKTTLKRSYVPCVEGRVYTGTFTSSLPSAFLAVIAGTVLTRIKDDATQAVVGATAVNQLATQSGFSTILNGANAEMDEGEIFDAKIFLKENLVVKLPGASTGADKGVERVGRFTAPTPAGYIITDYFSDVVKYPSPLGQQSVYTGKVIERYADKPAGSKMNICEGHSPPVGWLVIDRVIDSKICPREPGDQTKGYTYRVILKTP